jgi:hypothetical protein
MTAIATIIASAAATAISRRVPFTTIEIVRPRSSTSFGLPIGVNHKSLSTWEPMLEHLRNPLSSWENKYISLEGRIVLINVVLNLIPIFFISFMKMSVYVLKKAFRNQRLF